MKAKIQCQTCSQILGELEKEEITDEDQEQYKAMCDCDHGHQNAALVIEEGE